MNLKACCIEVNLEKPYGGRLVSNHSFGVPSPAPFGDFPSTVAASAVAKVAADQVQFQPEALTPAVWRAAAKGAAKKVFKAVKEFAVYEVAKGAYNRMSKWLKRHFKK
ncbi:hypothetical protein TcWFU_003945 [Taenia crassiceps]|uniref:Uncharacterized protein n=1 Tax=Taenia crassiceps TaxID=6207 RepID=A0ABR4Q0J2_9CEST